MHQDSLILDIKARREMLEVTQEMLADISGVNLRTIKQFESGKGNPTLDTITKIAEVLGLELKFQVKQPNGLTRADLG